MSTYPTQSGVSWLIRWLPMYEPYQPPMSTLTHKAVIRPGANNLNSNCHPGPNYPLPPIALPQLKIIDQGFEDDVNKLNQQLG